MKLTKYFLTAALLLTLSLNIAKADDNKNISKESDLAFQMKNEIKSMLLLPVYLKFEDKNLTGIAKVYVTVLKNGKIILTKVEGENNQLNSYVTSKINSINAWTGKEFAGRTFSYTIDMK